MHRFNVKEIYHERPFCRYVMKRTASDGIAIWFWSRDDVTVPSAVRFGAPEIQPDYFWSLPAAYFPFTPSCLSDHFDSHQIIFDDTFCVKPNF